MLSNEVSISDGRKICLMAVLNERRQPNWTLKESEHNFPLHKIIITRRHHHRPALVPKPQIPQMQLFTPETYSQTSLVPN